MSSKCWADLNYVLKSAYERVDRPEVFQSPQAVQAIAFGMHFSQLRVAARTLSFDFRIQDLYILHLNYKANGCLRQKTALAISVVSSEFKFRMFPISNLRFISDDRGKLRLRIVQEMTVRETGVSSITMT